MKSANQKLQCLCGFCVVVLMALAATAQSNNSTTNFIGELKSLTVEELMQQPVTTVERRASTVGESPAAVSVITQEDIRRSGATTIPEILRRVPGMDVARINNSTWAVSSRGFNDRFANKVLLQIDGRSLYNPVFAGNYWVDYPLDDIERIEVIRGPGATIWGANAVNGVINIVTKSAKDTQGGLLTAGGGIQELGFGSLRYGAKVTSNLFYRVYVKGFDRDQQFSLDRNPNDQWTGESTGLRLDWEPNDLNSVMFESSLLRSAAGQSNLRPQPTPPFIFTNLDDQVVEDENVQGRWIHRIEEDNNLTFQTYWEQVQADNENGYGKVRWDTFDMDFQHEFSPWERHKFVYGAGYRYIDIFAGPSTRDAGFTQEFFPANRHLQLASALVQDQFTLVEGKLYLTGGSKFEHNDFTGVELQPTGRLLWNPTTNQSIWFAYSRAVRTPTLAESNLRLTLAPRAPGVFPQIEPNPDFESEELQSFELGYRVQINHAVALDASIFHNDYDDLLVAMPLPGTAPPVPVFAPLVAVNGASGSTDGAELAVNWQALPELRLYGAYSLLNEHIHSNTQGAILPESIQENPEQQFFLQSSLDLPHNVELDLIGRWVDELSGSFPQATPAYFAMDLRLAWRPTQNLELSLTCQNLTDEHHLEFGSNPFVRTTVTEIDRAIFAKITWKF